VDFDLHIYSVQNWARKTLTIVLDLSWRAGAGARAEIAAGAGIHSANKDKIGWITGLGACGANIYTMFLERLPERLKDVSLELGYFVQE
jgi:hypothetical protein